MQYMTSSSIQYFNFCLTLIGIQKSLLFNNRNILITETHETIVLDFKWLYTLRGYIKNNRIHQLHTPHSSDIQEANPVCIYDISNTFVIINYRCSLLKYTCVSSRKPTSSIFNRQDHVHQFTVMLIQSKQININHLNKQRNGPFSKVEIFSPLQNTKRKTG